MATIRVGLQASSAASVVLAVWLASVVLMGRDPNDRPIWLLVAVGAIGLVAASLVAIRGSDNGVASFRAPLAIALGALAVAAIAFGLFVLGTTFSEAPGRHSEGYLLVVGLILLAHGGLAVAWLTGLALGRRG